MLIARTGFHNQKGLHSSDKIIRNVQSRVYRLFLNVHEHRLYLQEHTFTAKHVTFG